jgi:hypothetical protein
LQTDAFSGHLPAGASAARAAPLNLAERSLLEEIRLDQADVYGARYQQPEASARFGELFVDQTTGELRSYASLIEPTARAAAQLELNLQHYGSRARIRQMLAEKIEREVVPVLPLPWIQKIPDKLRNARKTGTFGLNTESGRGIVLWDDKASLSRLCPDDAREEASRLQKKYLPQIERAWEDGCHVQYAVFTMPNFAQGELAAGMAKIFNRLRDLLKRTDADGNKVFPEIEGALAVLEAPMGAYRDWNVHLNVMLVVRGFCDYEKLRRLWHWDVEFRKLPTGDIEGLRKSFRELIKYAVQATSEKSEHHATRDRSPELPPSLACDVSGETAGQGGALQSPGDGTRATAPPMLAWTGAELAEWLLAMHGFRRTRSYGCLYGAPKPAKADLSEFVWVGFVRWRDGRYRAHVRLLDSVPEDKSGVPDPLQRWRNFTRRVIPPPDDTPLTLGRAAQPLQELVS